MCPNSQALPLFLFACLTLQVPPFCTPHVAPAPAKSFALRPFYPHNPHLFRLLVHSPQFTFFAPRFLPRRYLGSIVNLVPPSSPPIAVSFESFLRWNFSIRHHLTDLVFFGHSGGIQSISLLFPPFCFGLPLDKNQAPFFCKTVFSNPGTHFFLLLGLPPFISFQPFLILGSFSPIYLFSPFNNKFFSLEMKFEGPHVFFR